MGAAVRKLYSTEGVEIVELRALENGETYVAAEKKFKRLKGSRNTTYTTTPTIGAPVQKRFGLKGASGSMNAFSVLPSLGAGERNEKGVRNAKTPRGGRRRGGPLPPAKNVSPADTGSDSSAPPAAPTQAYDLDQLKHTKLGDLEEQSSNSNEPTANPLAATPTEDETAQNPPQPLDLEAATDTAGPAGAEAEAKAPTVDLAKGTQEPGVDPVIREETYVSQNEDLAANSEGLSTPAPAAGENLVEDPSGDPATAAATATIHANDDLVDGSAEEVPAPAFHVEGASENDDTVATAVGTLLPQETAAAAAAKENTTAEIPTTDSEPEIAPPGHEMVTVPTESFPPQTEQHSAEIASSSPEASVGGASEAALDTAAEPGGVVEEARAEAGGVDVYVTDAPSTPNDTNMETMVLN